MITVGGRARVFGDDLDTGSIISSTRKRETIDASRLKTYLFENLAPGFAASVEPGDVIVAGRNFGCGSAMEVAATVILAAGIRAVLAKSFARSFYRNAMNNALLAIECDTSSIAEGDRLSVRLEGARATVHDLTHDGVITATPVPAIMLEILERGGIVGWIRSRSGAPGHR